MRPEKSPETAVEITHGYKVAGKVVEKTVALPQPSDYNITVDGDPENIFIRLGVPSKLK